MSSGTADRAGFLKNPAAFLVIILAAGFALRIFLSLFLTYEPDFNTWRVWGMQMSESGFGKFYDRHWCDYMPGYLYVLWSLDGIYKAIPWFPVEILFKLPANLADLGISALIFFWVRGIAPAKTALLCASAYFFNPAALSNSTFWGQVDSFHAFPIMLSVFLGLRRRFFLSGLFIALAFMIKPQTIVVFPVVGLLAARPAIVPRLDFRLESIRPVILFLVAAAITIFIVSLPFIWNKLDSVTSAFTGPLDLITSRFHAAYGEYKYTSLNAFNIWGAAAMWMNDEIVKLGLALRTWGTIAFTTFYAFVSCLLVFFTVVKSDIKKDYAYLVPEAITLILFALFLIVTRAHERHLLPAIAFFTLIVFRSWIFWCLYAIVSCVYVINMAYSHLQLVTKYAGVQTVLGISENLARVYIWIMVLLYVAAFLVIFRDYVVNAINYKKPIFPLHGN
ncbi:MAG TPA: glycosyltransferase 87 family protein [Thermodesulfobacteriota bacterium]|nr:glycosyltransferase 87 family protein [Thermodesulfobacteriota bacterium]